ncbi:DUF4166 domain-containing protein [Pelagibius sp. Alg239-R121]|uniref:DUF4166 domain-containing protein n=1 Tax=Pelagibius sp. Alg239-R121 TaxID=2993448 RepID=UPI0024A76A64|nr:DUF4166 domain-containing protein [Pelagibius sp. Alg239-R121]
MNAGSFTQRVLRTRLPGSRRSAAEKRIAKRQGPHSDPREGAHEKHDFDALVGKSGWRRLPASIQMRFASSSAADDVTYQGTMQSVRRSWAGYFIAQFCRLFGTPLTPFDGVDVPIEVRVHSNPAKGGMVWDRIYFFPGQVPIAVTSTKIFTSDNMLLECVGGGFGMRLKVFERDCKLHFLSREYFWRFGRFSIHLPHWITPGVAHVIHSDLGDGWFRFQMTIRHRYLGVTFTQDGTFKEKE